MHANQVMPAKRMEAGVLPLHHEDALKWFYQDPQGDIQGPFTAEGMAEWFSRGYFTMKVTVKRGCDEKFLTIWEMTNRWGRLPFLPGTNLPPIRTEPVNSVTQPLASTQHPNSVTQPLASTQHHDGPIPASSSVQAQVSTPTHITSANPPQQLTVLRQIEALQQSGAFAKSPQQQQMLALKQEQLLVLQQQQDLSSQQLMLRQQLHQPVGTVPAVLQQQTHQQEIVTATVEAVQSSNLGLVYQVDGVPAQQTTLQKRQATQQGSTPEAKLEDTIAVATWEVLNSASTSGIVPAVGASPLEELVSCPVCLEIYQNPQILSCLHVLCVNCTQKLIKHTYVECPECRHKTRSDDIRNDFNKQTLVELYLKQEKEETTGETAIPQSVANIQQSILCCQSCKKSKEVKWKCEDCKKYMCKDCELVHKSFPVTGSHTVKSIEDVSKEISIELANTLNQLNAEHSNLKATSIAEGRLLQDLEKMKVKSRQDINAHRDALKKSIDQHHDDQIKNLQMQLTSRVNSVVNKKQTLDKNILGLENKIALMTDLLVTKDIPTLVTQSGELYQEVQGHLTSIQMGIDHMKITSLSPVTVIPPLPWDPNTGTKFNFAPTHNQNVC